MRTLIVLLAMMPLAITASASELEDAVKADYEELHAWTRELGGELAEPIKSTLVERLRSMTTWVVQKPSS